LEFTFDEENGVIIDKATGQRCIIFPRVRLENVFSRLRQVFQSGANVIIAEAFKAAGKWFINEIPETAKNDMPTFLASAAKRFREGGLGHVEIVSFNPDKAELTFRIMNNFFAEMTYNEETYCYCVEAYVTGLFEQLIGRSPAIQKTKCSGKGDSYCEWHLSLPSPVEQDKT